MKKILFFTLLALSFISAHAQSEPASQSQLALQVSRLEARIEALEHKVQYLGDKQELESLYNDVGTMVEILIDKNSFRSTKKKALRTIEEAERLLDSLKQKVSMNTVLFNYTDHEVNILNNIVDGIRTKFDFVHDNF